MTELFFDGYSEYELEALKIPSDLRGKCLKQLVEYTRCHQKEGGLRYALGSCNDEEARFERCHRKSVNYYTGAAVGIMLKNNRSAFEEKKVSSSYESFFPTPTILNFTR